MIQLQNQRFLEFSGNPFSLLNAFKRKDFGSYWFETGTPTYLVKLLQKHHYDLERMTHEETDD